MCVAIGPDCHVGINVVPLGFEFQVWHEIVAAIDLSNTVKNVPVEDLNGFAINYNFLSTELGTECW